MIIIDLEATCDNTTDFDRNWMEIIQIGAVIMDGENVIARYSAFAKPTIRPTLTKFCTDLTGITQDQIDSAIPLKERLRDFDDWCKSFRRYHQQAWGSWGNYDRNQFKQDAARQGVQMDLLNTYAHYNLKQIWADQLRLRPRGLGSAVHLEGLKFQGRAHNALADAENIARLPTIKHYIKNFHDK